MICFFCSSLASYERVRRCGSEKKKGKGSAAEKEVLRKGKDKEMIEMMKKGKDKEEEKKEEEEEKKVPQTIQI